MLILGKFHCVYLFYLLFLILSCFFKNTKTKAAIIVVSFILTFICAETGADYNGYKYIYENSFSESIHGEYLYVWLCQKFNYLGATYNIFRIAFLSFFMALFGYSLYKLSSNFSLSFTLGYLMYIIYFVSAYRQFVTMAIFLYSIYLLFKKSKKLLPLLLNLIAIFIHRVAIVQFGVLLFVCIIRMITKKEEIIEKRNIMKISLILLPLSLVCRCVLYLLLSKTSLGAWYANITNYNKIVLVSLGLLSRIIILICICWLYDNCKISEKTNNMFLLYLFIIICYLTFPSENLTGRLTNNIKLLELILIPDLLLAEKTSLRDSRFNRFIYKGFVCATFIVAMAVFGNQMLTQKGYERYSHMFISYKGGAK